MIGRWKVPLILFLSDDSVQYTLNESIAISIGVSWQAYILSAPDASHGAFIIPKYKQSNE